MKKQRRLPWRAIRRVAQVACLAAFLWAFRKAEFTGSGDEPGALGWFFRLDPLVALSTTLAARKVELLVLVPALVVLALTLVLGRFFCGWFCPLGTCLDAAHRIVPPRADPPAGRWRRARYVLLVLVLVLAVAGTPAVGLLQPFALLVRGLAFAADPALSTTVGGPLDWAYVNAPERVSAVTEPVNAFLKGRVLPSRGSTYFLAEACAALLLGVFLLERFGRRFWCRTLCPSGALLDVFGRRPFLRRFPTKECKGCTVCSATCRMGAFDEAGRLRAGDCNLCMECLETCPHQVAGFALRRDPFPPKDVPADPGRRLLLGTAGVGLVLAAAGKVEARARERASPGPIRPPGAVAGAAFLDLCVRCGICMKLCPTNGLQPSGLEDGWGGVFAPRLVPRIGYCEYNCTLCGEACPTGAITRLDEAGKHSVSIGKAVFDPGRCLPFARGEPCICCEEHCPTPEKAIRFREVDVTSPKGESVRLQQPYVVFELCVGCGICENKCPLQGAAGVRVVAPSDAAVTAERAQRPLGAPPG